MRSSTWPTRQPSVNARAMTPMRRASYDDYVLAVALTLARRHRPVWSWRHWRRICRCGADLPCSSRHLIPINRGHWPSQEGPRC
jgi:hypothetical protein